MTNNNYIHMFESLSLSLPLQAVLICNSSGTLVSFFFGGVGGINNRLYLIISFILISCSGVLFNT